MGLDDYIPAREAAQILGLKYHTLMSRVRRGKLPAVRKGWAVLIKRQDLGEAGHEHRNSNLAQAAG